MDNLTKKIKNSKRKVKVKKAKNKRKGGGTDHSNLDSSTKLDHYALWITMTLEEKKAAYNLYNEDGTIKKELVVKGTDGEYCKIMGMHQAVLSRWKDKDELWERRDHYMKRYRVHTANVLRGLIRNCITKGNYQDVKGYFEIVERMKLEGKRSYGSKALEDMAEAMDEGAVESGNASVNEDGTVDLTLRLKKYKFEDERPNKADHKS